MNSDNSLIHLSDIVIDNYETTANTVFAKVGQGYGFYVKCPCSII